jgi:hypothetical protein
MTLTRLIGDIHGKIYDYQAYSITDFKGPTIQVGDFGIGFAGPYWHDNVAAWQEDHPHHRFIRGNHDDPTKCKTMPGYINDGVIENDVMFIGGAWSIDNPNAPPGWYKRTKDIDWWADEECSDAKFEQMLDIYKAAKPRVMITHDCPAKVSYPMFWGTGFIKGPVYPNRTGAWFDKFIDAHEPDEWYFGHWHKTMAYKHGRTIFQCIGELDYIDVEL